MIIVKPSSKPLSKSLKSVRCEKVRLEYANHFLARTKKIKLIGFNLVADCLTTDVVITRLLMILPTDMGMCCSFNMKAAEEIFIETGFTKILTEMQGHDKETSAVQSSLPNWYTHGSEPKTIPGKNKGLVLMLDSHSNRLSASSVDTDFRGFTTFIGSSESFPIMSQEGIEIRPGDGLALSSLIVEQC